MRRTNYMVRDFIIVNGLTIQKIYNKAKGENFVLISYNKATNVTKNDFDVKTIRIKLDNNMAQYILGQGILNCITDGIDSTFEVQDIYSQKKFVNPEERKYLYLVKNRIFSIKGSKNQNSVDFSISHQYQIIDDIKSEFKYKNRPRIKFETTIDTKDALSMANFFLADSIRVHSE